MNILLTGSTGFLGSSLLKEFLSRKYQVKVILRKGSDLSRLPDHGKFERILVDDFKDLFSKISLKDFKEYTFVNCAWKGVDGPSRNKLWQIKDNVDLCYELILLALKSDCSHFINFGSHAEYGPINKKISEDNKKQPTTLYGHSKKIVNNLSTALLSQESVLYTNLRVFNIYGPSDNEGWFIPYIVKTLMSDNIPKLTKCEQVWDYLYIEDFTNAVIKTVEKKKSGVFNLGSGNGVTLRSVVNIILECLDKNIDPLYGAIPYRKDQVMHLEADIKLIKEALDWEPVVGLDEGIKKTISYLITKYEFK